MQPASALQNAVLLLTRANVVDLRTGFVDRGVDDAMSAERIVTVGREARSTAGLEATVLPTKGKFVLPGLWDVHVHAHREGRAQS
jgi:predicted amidohydrolase YtcJ